MVRAYVTVVTTAGTAQEAVEQIREVAAVRHADIVAGEFDVIAQVEADSERHLLQLVTEDVQSIKGVGRTSTCIVLE